MKRYPYCLGQTLAMAARTGITVKPKDKRPEWFFVTPKRSYDSGNSNEHEGYLPLVHPCC